jgi:membrane protein
MAAALTYYTMLSLAPLMMIAIAIAGYFYDDAVAQAELIEQVRTLTNDGVANTVSGLIKNATKPNSGLLAGTISVAILIFGASGVFSQLYDTFNDIWHVPYDSRAGFMFSLQKRLIGIGMVLLAGALLVGTLMLSSAITYLNTMLGGGMMAYWLNLTDRSLSFLLMPLIFAMIFWFFPSAKIQWHDVWPAGLLTAALVAGSRYLIELYLRFSSTSEVYGAAGSLVVLLVWVYITGMIVFYGASFSHAWATTFGSLSEEEETDSERSAPPLVPERRVSEQ